MTIPSQRKLLILTAGIWQVPVIRKAQALGLEVVATDANPQAPGLRLANHAEVIDSLDHDGMVELARRHRIDGVIAEQTDVAVTTAAFVAEKLGLPGIGYEVALAATNKWLMREKCRLAGIPVPKYRKAATADEAVAAAEAIGLPVVIKPVDGQASRGVAKVWRREEVPGWFARAKAASREDAVLVEEMMTGVESSAEGFVAQDQIHVLAICDKTKCAPPYSFDLRLIYPGIFAEEVHREIRSLNARIVRALGISLGITHAEYIVTPQGVRLLEIAARGCGARVASDLIPAMTGVDLIEARIRQALGEGVRWESPATTRCGILEFLMLSPGIVNKITGVEEAKRIAGVVDLGFLVKPGDRIGPAENGAGRPGFLLAVGASRGAVLGIAEEVRRTVRVETTAGAQITVAS
jgi:biotin carboxylase